MNKKMLKELRKQFREAVLKRDQYRCRKCGLSIDETDLSAHHITDRHLMPNDGYVLENGITLCDRENGCHWQAELFHISGKVVEGYSPEDLYKLIDSSFTKALEASKRLSND